MRELELVGVAECQRYVEGMLGAQSYLHAKLSLELREVGATEAGNEHEVILSDLIGEQRFEELRGDEGRDIHVGDYNVREIASDLFDDRVGQLSGHE